MRATSVLFVFLLSACVLVSAQLCSGNCYPFWKVFCQQTPIYRGRADPIADPGMTSGHVHRVFGANAFNPGGSTRSPMDEYNILQKSTCTTCSISIDKSAYWIPDLYYQWPDGTYSLVPNAGLTVYYPSRGGDKDQQFPKFHAHPPGMRIIAGDPYRRSYNATSVRDSAVSYACLGRTPSPETPNFPKDISECINGLRAQVWFPQCWDGVNIDSPDHKSHVSYPVERANGGNCPSTHPVRLPGIFFEVLFSVTDFPKQNYNPYRWACGDSTGYGYHGDFLNGWDSKIQQAALDDPTCLANSTNNGNSVQNCKAFAPYLVDPGQDKCLLSTPIPNIEDLGINHKITALPGCNPVTDGPNPAVPCNKVTPQPQTGPTWRRFLLQLKNTSNYVTSDSIWEPLKASVRSPNYYSQVWTATETSNGIWTIQSDLTAQFVTSPQKDALMCNRGSPDTWETFVITDKGQGFFSIQARSNNMYISLAADGTLHADSATVGDGQLWSLVDPSKFPNLNPIKGAKYPQ